MLDRIHLHDECDADRDLAVRVVQMDKDLLYLYYSNDKGFTFYNTDAPREAIRHNPRRGLKSTHEDLHDLHNEALRRLQCIPTQENHECSEECKDNGGRACCEGIEENDRKCLLNAKGNTCNCEEDSACYIEMRCHNNKNLLSYGTKADDLTWQNGECRVKPGKVCYQQPSYNRGILVLNKDGEENFTWPCTDGHRLTGCTSIRYDQFGNGYSGKGHFDIVCSCR